MQMIGLCFLEEYPSLEEGILNVLDISRQQLKKYQLKKKFLNTPIKKHYSYLLPVDLINHLQINSAYNGDKVDILYEDDYFLVINKPYKVHMHPLKYSDQDNLLSFLRTKDSHLLKVNSGSYDRGLLYRLDYETSGLVYYAKSQALYDEIRVNFNQIMERKQYFAIVSGHFQSEGEYCHYLKSFGPKGRRIISFDQPSKNTVESKMLVKMVSYNRLKHYSLLSIQIQTGHRHQIRSQLAHIGYPILGDELYGGAPERRVFLHAYQYCFKINGKVYDLKCLDGKLFNDFFDLNTCA